MIRRGVRFAAAAPVILFAFSAAADPLKLEPGKQVVLTCSTQSVVMLPAAAGSHGDFSLKLDLKADRSVWSVTDVGADHKDSLAVRDKARCAEGCELIVPASGRFELWSPKKTAAGSLKEGEALTVIALDPVTLKLSATTVLGKEIAAFEQGTCKSAN